MKKKTTQKGSDILRRIATGGDPVKEKQYAKDVARVRRRLSIAGQIYRLRKKAGMSQVELAKKAGLHQSAVARLESETYKGYSVPTLEKIVEVFCGSVEVKLIVPKKPQSTRVQPRATRQASARSTHRVAATKKKTTASAKKKTPAVKRSKTTA